MCVLGFGKTFFTNQNYYIFPDYLNSIIGGVAGYTIIWVIIFLYKKIINQIIKYPEIPPIKELM